MTATALIRTSIPTGRTDGGVHGHFPTPSPHLSPPVGACRHPAAPLSMAPLHLKLLLIQLQNSAQQALSQKGGGTSPCVKAQQPNTPGRLGRQASSLTSTMDTDLAVTSLDQHHPGLSLHGPSSLRDAGSMGLLSTHAPSTPRTTNSTGTQLQHSAPGLDAGSSALLFPSPGTPRAREPAAHGPLPSTPPTSQCTEGPSASAHHLQSPPTPANDPASSHNQPSVPAPAPNHAQPLQPQAQAPWVWGPAVDPLFLTAPDVAIRLAGGEVLWAHSGALAAGSPLLADW